MSGPQPAGVNQPATAVARAESQRPA
jgi:hypothetical protein